VKSTADLSGPDLLLVLTKQLHRWQQLPLASCMPLQSKLCDWNNHSNDKGGQNVSN
jgi:hypothetical protein